uniref:NADH dehydrogenase [ubiquinone] 1 beta subcomplex subunit 6 n=1 Tax=Sinocyclocheilus anshuiensis TaxID=1608454 RepID=A0A671K031_9TELE
MTGYSADEKLRFEQLTKLRRQWLKDQELSPREPTVAPKTPGPYNASVFAVTRILIPAWIVHYYVKYHVSKMPYGIVALKPRLFPGDTILETGEVVPDLPEADSHGHH